MEFGRSEVRVSSQKRIDELEKQLGDLGQAFLRMHKHVEELTAARNNDVQVLNVILEALGYENTNTDSAGGSRREQASKTV